MLVALASEEELCIIQSSWERQLRLTRSVQRWDGRINENVHYQCQSLFAGKTIRESSRAEPMDKDLQPLRRSVSCKKDRALPIHGCETLGTHSPVRINLAVPPPAVWRK